MAKRRKFTPQFIAEIVIEVLTGQNSKAELCRRHDLSQEQLSKWKHQLLDNAATLFEFTDKQSNDYRERIAETGAIRGTIELGVRHPKRSLDFAELNRSKKRQMVEALHTDCPVRHICDVLGFNRSSLYYQPRHDPNELELRDEIEKLAARYPKYGYRRITQPLLRMGYSVRYRRVARLMKAENLSAAVKRTCQTTKSFDGCGQWGNRLENLDICRRNQVWIGDITYVRLKGQFVYVSVLMDVFTRMIRGWRLSRHLTEPLTLRPLQQVLSQSVPEIHHSDQGVQYLSTAYISTFIGHGVEISLAHRGVLGRTVMPKDLSALSRKKKSISMSMMI